MTFQRTLIIGIVLSLASQAVFAADGIGYWQPVSDQRLEQMRGGFDLGSGIVASLGIDRAVYINGNLVTSTSINIPDISHISSAQATALAAVMNTANLVQNGPGNSVDPSTLSQARGATIIQNTLNNQQIQALTTLNVGTNSLNLFRAMGLQDSLQSALIGSQGH
ncbi:hypothetical protein [Dyella sp. GSA-30]|uniref:hypothetical protein n=1 Tax=Dyella sp. GSA-30 TaxID=2994496 RepID=UPI00248F89C4|nr:hypothetical protein [Dyella sp. GSA-30]BDU20754.1 hypothetical protein DYGSA30_22110 [Dyella sp. GSA-30]